MRPKLPGLTRAARLPGRSWWDLVAAVVGIPSGHASVHSRSQSSLTVDVGDSSISFSTGKFANLADGSAVVQSGSTCVMVTAVSDKTPKNSGGGIPLMVDYRVRAAAAGRIPQNFLRRELGAGENETLVCRFIDRSLRPFFPAGYSYETQVICNMLAVDGRHDPEVLSLNGASAALTLSDIPWGGPVGAVRVTLQDGKFLINPSMKVLDPSSLNLVVTCTKDNIVMVEGSASEMHEELFCEAVLTAFHEAQPIIDCLSELKQWRKKPLREVQLAVPTPEVKEEVRSLCRVDIDRILTDHTHMKMSRDEALFAVRDAAKQELQEKMPSVDSHLVVEAFWATCREVLQENVIERQLRCDGRAMTELRPIHCEVDVLGGLHGSAVFKRGETQVISTVTFDSPMSAYRADLVSMMMGAQRSKQFMVNYEFPPFSTNTIGRFLMPGRREIGHGSLANKALSPLLPGSDFPFSIRLVTQVLDSNGSSSMASVCSGSLALFDAGIPMAKAAAGVACGLAVKINPETGEIDKYQILTDIAGIEDAAGAMDFKMAGTREGVTSVQLDVKGIPGLPYHIFREAVMQSRAARCHVLDIMDQCQSLPRPQLKENGPSYVTIDVPPEKRRKLIGAQGHRIRTIVAETGAEVQTISDDQMSIFAPTREAMNDVMKRVETILDEAEPEEPEFEFGAIYVATVREVLEYGLVLELGEGAISLLHKSQISQKWMTHPNELGVEVGHKLSVKYLGRDPITGRHRTSRKALLPSAPTAHTTGGSNSSDSSTH